MSKVSSATMTGEFSFVVALLISLLSMLGIFISDIYVPALPFMQADLNISKAQLEVSVALYFLTFSFSQLIYGPLAERYGRKPIIILGLVISVIGSVMCIFANDGLSLIQGRLIQGFGMGAPVALTRVILRDLCSGVQLARWSSYISAFLLIAPALSLIIGGYFTHLWHWSSIFIFLLISILLMLVAVWRILPETHPHLNTPNSFTFREILTYYKSILLNRTFCGYTAVAATSLAGMVLYLTLSSFLFQESLGLSVLEYSWISIYVSLALIGGMLFNATLVVRIHPDKLIRIGLTLQALAGLWLMTSLSLGVFTPLSLITSVIFFAFGCSIVFANAASGAFTPFNKNIGFVGALFGASQMLFSGGIGTLGALLQSQANWILSITFFILGIVGFWIFKKLIGVRFSSFN